MAQTKDYRLGEFTYPRGWFMIAEDKELNTHKPLAVRFFGRDFALYRGMATGKVVLLDAYCPHMQTHLGAKNTTSYVVLDNNGTNIIGDDIVCPYHGWKFGADGVCNDIPYHDGPIPAAARVKSWLVKESMGAIWVWHDPEGGEPDYDVPSLPIENDPSWVRPGYDHLGTLNMHPIEAVDNIADYGHFSPIHGSSTEGFENEFHGHEAIQRMRGPHRTLTDPSTGVSTVLHTITKYVGPGALQSHMTGMFDSYLVINHTPVEDGKVMVWHGLWVKAPSGQATVTPIDRILGQQFQQTALTAFSQDFECWSQKAPNINGMYLPSDGAFIRARAWYKQFYNPRAKYEEYEEQFEGPVYVPRGSEPYTVSGKTL